MKVIPVSPDLLASVSDVDYERVSRYSWSKCAQKKDRFYIHANINGKFVYLHRFIRNARAGELVDHRDHNPLNNTRRNLRVCNNSQNLANSRKRKSAQNYKGIYRRMDLKATPWTAEITSNRKHLHLGYFRTKKLAAAAYDRAARKYHGKFALTNFVS